MAQRASPVVANSKLHLLRSAALRVYSPISSRQIVATEGKELTISSLV